MEKLNDALVGRLVDGRYEVLERLARGGMATVYLALDKRLDRQVALKVMHPHMADDPTFQAKFTQEARSAARISHPGVVAVYDSGADGDMTYLTMEFVAGETLRHVLREEAPLTLRAALDVTERVLEALAAAHQAGVVHRDVKPENVLVCTDGRIKVADFGLSRAVSSRSSVSTGMVMGTIAYLAPEIVNETGCDVRSDVYAVGVMMFELLTGRQPFVGDTAISVAYKHVQEDFPLMSEFVEGVPTVVEDVALWATAKSPADRPANATEMLSELRAIREELTEQQLNVRPSAIAAAGLRAAMPKGSTVAMPREMLRGLPVGDPTGVQPVAEPAQPVSQDIDVVDTPPRQRRRRPRGWVIVAALIAVILAITVGTWYQVIGPGSRVSVPDVAAQPFDTAQNALRGKGFNVSKFDAYNETVPKGTVISMQPVGGTSARRNTTVQLQVSLGSEFVQLPELVGQTKDDAQRAMTAAGVTIGAVTEQFDDNVPAGSIVSTKPVAGQRVKRADPIDIVVSKGREPLQIPNIVNKSKAEAQQRLKAAGFVAKFVEETNDSVSAGQVISQKPAEGTGFRGDVITVTISKGKEDVTVPDLRQRQLEQAMADLENLGLKVKVERLSPFPSGIVWGQSPAAGTKVKPGDTVMLQVF